MIYCNHRFDFCRGLHPYVSKLRAEEVQVLPTRFTSWVSHYDLYSSVKEFKEIFSIKLLTSCYSFKRLLSLLFFSLQTPFSSRLGANYSSAVREGTSSLFGGQHGLLEILQFLMNMDRDFQPIIGWHLTDLTHTFICTLSHLIKNKSIVCDGFAC